jgi:hypothetical protein
MDPKRSSLDDHFPCRKSDSLTRIRRGTSVTTVLLLWRVENGSYGSIPVSRTILWLFTIIFGWRSLQRPHSGLPIWMLVPFLVSTPGLAFGLDPDEEAARQADHPFWFLWDDPGASGLTSTTTTTLGRCPSSTTTPHGAHRLVGPTTTAWGLGCGGSPFRTFQLTGRPTIRARKT